jgi:RimJ/RimL family protein N-acetyltransferase
VFLGWFEFRPLDDDSSAVVELGYRLNKAAWGRGYATDGARALMDKGFTELAVERVTANTMAVNQASRRVMEKSGLSVRTHPGRVAAAAIEADLAGARSQHCAADTEPVSGSR